MVMEGLLVAVMVATVVVLVVEFGVVYISVFAFLSS